MRSAKALKESDSYEKHYFQTAALVSRFRGCGCIGLFYQRRGAELSGQRDFEKNGLVSLPLDKAKIKAKSENKHILVEVSAIWCATCRRLDSEIFADEDVKRVINERFVFSRLEYESDEGQNFLEKHKAAGFPNLWLLDGDGRVVKRLSVTFDKGEFLWQLYR
jgi:thioredoxin-related protein